MGISMICSIDSFVAAACMAFCGASGRTFRWAVCGFAVCDTLAGTLGAFLASHGLVGVAVSALVVFAALLTYVRQWHASYILIPVLLSFDNLVMGSAHSQTNLLSSMIDGASSGLLAWLGFYVVRLSSCIWTRWAGVDAA